MGLALPAAQLLPDRLRLQLFLPHLLGKLFLGCVQRVPIRLGLGQLSGGQLVVGGHLDPLCPELFQLLQPDRHLQSLQFLPEHQEFLRLFRLDAQGLHLEFQLVNFVVDAHKVFICAFQLALRLLLPVAEAGDARSLLKDLPAVGALDGQNLVDLALADDGVSLPAQAGVHEQLVDILEPAGPAVDIVFALPGTVIPAGDRHLTLFHGEQMPGVVQHQRNFSEAQPFAPGGSVKNHIFHLAAPEGSGGLLSHNPADGIGNVGFSRAVRPHNGRNVLAKGQHGFFREGFKALDLQCF